MPKCTRWTIPALCGEILPFFLSATSHQGSENRLSRLKLTPFMSADP